ncbi:putative collagen-binding domain-containing protein, partial [Singulisphaera rosea]
PSPRPITVHSLEPGTRYVASCFDPVSGHRTEIGAVHPNPTGDWTVKPPGHGTTDWVLVLSAEKRRTP